MTELDIMSVREMIDKSFGDPKTNTVNFKLIQAVLVILARQLRVLKRHVYIQTSKRSKPGTSIAVTELKIHSKSKKTTEKSGDQKTSSSDTKSQKHDSSQDRKDGPKLKSGTQLEKDASDKTTPSKKITDQFSEQPGKTTSSKKTTDKFTEQAGKTTTSKTTTDQFTEQPGKTTPSKKMTVQEQTSTQISSTQKASTQVSSVQKGAAEIAASVKSSPAKSSSAKPSTEISSTDKSSTEKSSTEKSSTEKSSTEKSSTDKSSTDKSSTDKSSTEKSSTDKSSAEKSSTDKSSTEKSTSEKPSTDKSSTEKSSTDKSSTEKYSSEKSASEKSLTEKSSTDKSSTVKSSTDKSLQGRIGTEKSEESSLSQDTDTRTKTTALQKPLTEFATDKSKDAKAKIGGSVKGRKGEAQGSDEDEDEILHEKLLVVSRTPSTIDADDYQQATGAEQSAVATQEQYKAIVAAIRELQARYNQKDMLFLQGVGDNTDKQSDIRIDLQKRTSMTDPIAALNMSARLEAAEKRLAEIMPIATKLAGQIPGIDLESAFDDTILKEGDIREWGPPGLSSQTPPAMSKTAAFKQPPRRARKERQMPQAITLDFSDDEESEEEDIKEEGEPYIETEVEVEHADRVTHDELNLYIQEIFDATLKKIKGVNNSCISCEATYKKLIKMDEKLEGALKLGDRFDILDLSVEEYADEVNALDGKLGTQMTEYQDALTQMQYDLEVALDTLAEALASPSGATAAVAELNGQFTILQLDLSNTTQLQSDLKKMQSAHAVDLNQLMKKVDKLQATKSTREEVVDALSDKVGISALNGMVAIQQFDAVSGDFEKRIGSSYEQFNNKEIVWQKAIDDLIRAINEKADYVQMVRLNDEIQKYIDMLRASLEEMLEQVGELDSNPTEKKLERFSNCLSCGSRFYNDTTEDILDELLSRPPVVGAESSDVKEDSVPKICIPGQPVPHPVDPRSITCQRYCGASIVSHSDRKSSLKVPTTEIKSPSTVIGTDGKVYMTDVRKKPCAPCNIKKLSPQISKVISTDQKQVTGSLEMIMSDVGVPIHEKEIKSSLYQPIPTKRLVFAPMDTINSESEAPEDEKEIAS